VETDLFSEANLSHYIGWFHATNWTRSSLPQRVKLAGGDFVALDWARFREECLHVSDKAAGNFGWAALKVCGACHYLGASLQKCTALCQPLDFRD
jgi:hypothetical protein